VGFLTAGIRSEIQISGQEIFVVRGYFDQPLQQFFKGHRFDLLKKLFSSDAAGQRAEKSSFPL
jgi:hypothetical protein